MLTTLTWLDIALIALAALLTSGVIAFATRKPRVVANLLPVGTSSPNCDSVQSFDFDLSGNLTCSNESAAALLADLGLLSPDWGQFRSIFNERFPGLPGGLTASDKSRLTVISSCSIADPMELELERHAKGISVNLRNRIKGPQSSASELHLALSSLNELDLIRAVSEKAPFPIWQSFPDGAIGWANTCYKSLDVSVTRKPDQSGAPLFSLPEVTTDSAKPVRISLKDTENNRTYWFDVSRRTFAEGHLNFAMDIHAVVNAESAQRNFVQTLAKTFAHLATGLAIFDRNRQLVLFNPSLIDLTELRPEFLTARPNLFSFFDQLRDKQVMPEPKSYASWRERIADVVSAASDDNFSETWHLPNGLTYRVTGRPHPDGAIAFLFEDISAEISLTRRFRSEADVTRSALDALEDGLAIFNAAGFIQQSNRAMAAFVGLEDVQAAEGMSVQDITRLWQKKCRPSPAWGDVRDFVSGNAERETWAANLRHKDGRFFNLQVAPLASGATLVTLSMRVTDPSKIDPKARKPKQSSTVAA